MPLQVDVIGGRWQIHRVTVNTSIQRFKPLNVHRKLLTLYLSVLPANIASINQFHLSVARPHDTVANVISLQKPLNASNLLC